MNDKRFQQIKIQKTDSNRVWTYCPFHSDSTTPNLSISLSDKYLGKYKCWACNKEGRLTNRQIEILGLKNSYAYKVDYTKLSMRWERYIKSCKENIQKFPLFKIALATQLNVSTQSLDDWMVGYDGDAYIIPMYREDLGEYTREAGLCGAQRRFPDGTKRSTYGSALGYMYPIEDEQPLGEEALFICEGFSDAINIWDLGYSSIARPNCHFMDSIIPVLYEIGAEVLDIVIVPDNDEVGKSGADLLLREVSREFDCTIFNFDGAKDIRQLIRLRGKDYVSNELARFYDEF